MATSTGKIYQNDWGVVFSVLVSIDLTLATAYKLKIIKPDGRNVEWIPTVVSPATSGYLTYTSVSGDLDVVGNYKLNAYVTFTTGVFTGETAVFRVYKVGE
jgi:hypothetical protein